MRTARIDRIPTWLGALTVLFSASVPAFAGRDLWTRSGPLGGDVTALAAAPSDPAVVYAGTGAGAGRVFRSIDGGRTWDLRSGGIGPFMPYRIWSIAVDPRDPLTAFASAGVLFRTTNGGDSWVPLPGVPVDGSAVVVSALAADPKTSGTIYAATEGTGGEGLGFFKSTDGGDTWTVRNDGLSEFSQIFSMAISPSDPDILYLETAFDLYRTSDGSAHWTHLTFPAAYLHAPIVVDPRDPDTVLAQGYVSRDGGATWSPADGGLGISAIAFSPDGSTLYGTSTIGASTALFESADESASWNRLAVGPPNDALESFTATPASLFAGLEKSGVFRSDDGGISWRSSNSGFTGVPLVDMAVSPADPARLWIGTFDGQTYRSDDAGTHWTPTSLEQRTFAIAADPSRADTAYAVGFGKCFTTTDAGRRWTPGEETGLLQRLVADPSFPGTLYATAYDPHHGAGVYKSLDGGRSWRRIDGGIDSYLLPGAIAIDPRVASRIYVAGVFGTEIWRSDDGGGSWQRAAAIDDIGVFQIVVGPDSTVLAAGSKGTWWSTDAGAHWTLSTGLPPVPPSSPPGSTIVPAADPSHPGTFFAADAGRFFVSRDAGWSWAPFSTNGFPGELVLQLEVSRTGRLLALTKGGVFEFSRVSVVVPPTRTAAVVGTRSR